MHLADGSTAILKYAIPDFVEHDALIHASRHGVPVPAVLAHIDRPGGTGAAILLEDLGPDMRTPTLQDAAHAAVLTHQAPGPEQRPVLDSTALAELPQRALDNLAQLNAADRWNGPGTAALRTDLEALARVSQQRAQGARYTSVAFGRRCAEAGIAVSTGRSGSCYDNAVTESFFASLETELIDRTRFARRADAQQGVFSYIEGFYNPWRRHSANRQLSPIEYERRHTHKTRNSSTKMSEAA